MAKIKVFINERQIKKDRTTMVYAITNLQGKTIKIKTGVSIKVQDWNKKEGTIIGKGKKVDDDNLTIQNVISGINDIMVKYRLQNKVLTTELLSKEWRNELVSIDFYKYCDVVGTEIKTESAKGTHDIHATFLSQLKEFRKELNFHEIDKKFMKQYENWLKKTKKNEWNTAWLKLNRLKSYCKWAVRDGVIEKDPIADYEIKARNKREIVFLSSEQLKKFWNVYENPKKYRLTYLEQLSLRSFLLQSVTGMRISDVNGLRHENVSENEIIYVPIKTRKSNVQPVRVPLNKYSRQLINDAETTRKEMFPKRPGCSHNYSLKKIAGIVKIDKHIHSHVGRHTFATLWLEKTKDIAKLQRLLGHADIASTMKYVHITNQGMIMEMQNFEDKLF